MTTLAHHSAATPRLIVDAFIAAAVGLVCVDALWAAAHGGIGFGGLVLTMGLQLCLTLVLGGAFLLARVGLDRMPASPGGAVSYYVATQSFLVVGGLYIRPRPLELALMSAALLGIFMLSWLVVHRYRPQSLGGYVVGGLASCALFLLGFESVLDAVRGAKSTNAWFGLFLVAAIGASVFSLVIGSVLSRARPVPVPLAAAMALGACLVAVSPAFVFPGQYPRFRTVTHILCVIAVALAAQARVRLRPRWRVLAGILSVGSLAWVIGIADPLSAAMHDVGARSMVTDPLIRETGVLRFSASRLLARVSDAEPSVVSVDRQPMDGRRLATSADSAILITVDTLRYDHTGYSGAAPAGLTPGIDRLAAESQRFHRATVQGGWTSLSLPSILWSQYPKNLKLEMVDGERSPLREPSRNLIETLGAAGFLTVAVTNDGYDDVLAPRLGFARGVERVVYPSDVLRKSPASERDTEDATDALTVDLAIEELKQVGDRKFFMWVHLFDPHRPDEHGSGAALSGYAGDVHYTDQQILRFLDALDEHHFSNKVVVVLTADHGEGLGEHRNKDRSIGHGLNVFEESTHVPLLMRVPGWPAAEHHNEVAVIDIAPTLLGLLRNEPADHFRGVDLFGEDLTHRIVFSETWRFREKREASTIHVAAALWHGKKVMLDVPRQTFALFDLSSDPLERTPIFSDDPRFGPWAHWMIRELVQWHGAHR